MAQITVLVGLQSTEFTESFTDLLNQWESVFGKRKTWINSTGNLFTADKDSSNVSDLFTEIL